MSAIKITETPDQLVLRPQYSTPVFLYLMFIIMPLAATAVFASRMGVETLDCQRKGSAEINCIQKKSVWLGFKSFPDTPLAGVARAEYSQREEKDTDDEDCSTRAYHEFHLIFKDNQRYQVFEPHLSSGCSAGNPDWIEKQVQKFNTSQVGTFQVVRDTRFAPSSISLFGFCLGIVTVMSHFLGIGKSIKFEFDRPTGTCRIIHYNWWVLSTITSYPFSDVRVCLESKEDDDSIFHEISLILKGAKPQRIIQENDTSCDRMEMMEQASKIARFIGKKVEEINPANTSAEPLAEAAQELLDYHEKLYSETHQFVRVKAEDFSHLDLKFYDRAQKELEGLGFEKLADIEDQTISDANPTQPRVLIRMMLSRDRRTVAGIYAMPLPGVVKVLQAIGLVPKGGKIVDLESEFEGGTFLTTSNTQGLDNSAPFPGIERQQVPGTTSIAELVKQHRTRLKALNAHAPALIIPNFEEAIALQHRLQNRKNSHKQAQGYLTPEDIQRHARKDQQQAAEALGNAVDILKTQPSEEE